MPHPLLHEAGHRPWPVPDAPWVMRMIWRDLLFAHWPVPAEAVGARLPPGLRLDTYDGVAWVGVVPFGMEGTGPRGLPLDHVALPGLTRFLELNVRTYVVNRVGEPKPGVWFFSLDADSPPAVAAARALFGLPYYRARMSMGRAGDWVAYDSLRTHRGIHHGAFSGRYRPVGEAIRPMPGSLEEWLTERYCLYAVRRGRLVRGDIHHRPWGLRPLEAELAMNTVAVAHGFTLDWAPLLHLGGDHEVLAWAPVRVPDGIGSKPA